MKCKRTSTTPILAKYCMKARRKLHKNTSHYKMKTIKNRLTTK